MNLRDRWRLHTRYYLPSTADRVVVLLCLVGLCVLGVAAYSLDSWYRTHPLPTQTPIATPGDGDLPCCAWDGAVVGADRKIAWRLRCFLDAAVCDGGSVLTVIVAPTPIPDCGAASPTPPPPTEIASECLPDPRAVVKELRECEARRRRDAEETMLNFHCPAPEPTP